MRWTPRGAHSDQALDDLPPGGCPGRGEGTRPAAEHREPALRVPPRGRHAGRAPRHGGHRGSVIATRGAIVPAAVGVDIGCGMEAVRTTLRAADLPESLGAVRSAIEQAVPHGRTNHGGPGTAGRGASRRRRWEQPGRRWAGTSATACSWSATRRWTATRRPRPTSARSAPATTSSRSAWTRRTGSGSCCTRARAASATASARYFIELAKARHAKRCDVNLPDQDLAYFAEGTRALRRLRRRGGLGAGLRAANRAADDARPRCAAARAPLPPFAGRPIDEAVNCHHNYVARERHFGANVLVTRKGAVSARAGRAGHHPRLAWARAATSCAARASAESFESCSHGAGRVMSRGRGEAPLHRWRTTPRRPRASNAARTKDVIDEIPGAYKDIDARDGRAGGPGRGRAHAAGGHDGQGLTGGTAGGGSVSRKSRTTAQ